jgi:putative CocE/NonD family hydrolase
MRKIRLALGLLVLMTTLTPVIGHAAAAGHAAATTYPKTVVSQVDVVTRYGDTINIDLCFPSYDGVTMAKDGPWPVIGELTPYTAAGQAPCFMPTGVATGYVSVHINSPGSGDSCCSTWDYGDKSWAYRQYDAIEWLAKQPWSNGEFGSIGESGVGVPQSHVAALHPPHYTTAIIQPSTADAYKSLKPGGIRSGTELLVCAIPGFEVTAENRLYTPTGDPATDIEGAHREIDMAEYRSQHLGPGVAGTCPPLQDSWLHPNRDSYWDDRTADLSTVTMPVWIQGSPDDLFAWGSEDDYLSRGSKDKMFTFGYTSHAGNQAGFDQTAEALRWFDYWLKGRNTGIKDDLKNNRFRYNVFPYFIHKQAADYPIPDTQYTPYYLSSGAPDPNVAVAVNGSLSTTPPATEGSANYVYTPVDGKNANPFGAGESTDQRLETGTRVSFIGQPLTHDTEVTGSTRMTLFATTSATDTDWVAKLLDVAPDGSITMVDTLGYLNSKFRGWEGDWRSSSPTPPNEPVEYHIQFYPTSWMFKAGHTIGLSISSADVGETYPNQNPATISVLFGPSHPTEVTLPIIPQ